MAITNQQKDDVRQRLAVRNGIQAALQEIYHYFHTVHGTRPEHKEVVKLLGELAQDLSNPGRGGH